MKPVAIIVENPNDSRVKTAKRMHEDKSIKIEGICETLRISRPALYHYLRLAKG
jgi:hypothetical protein